MKLEEAGLDHDPYGDEEFRSPTKFGERRVEGELVPNIGNSDHPRGVWEDIDERRRKTNTCDSHNLGSNVLHRYLIQIRVGVPEARVGCGSVILVVWVQSVLLPLLRHRWDRRSE